MLPHLKLKMGRNVLRPRCVLIQRDEGAAVEGCPEVERCVWGRNWSEKAVGMRIKAAIEGQRDGARPLLREVFISYYHIIHKSYRIEVKCRMSVRKCRRSHKTDKSLQPLRIELVFMTSLSRLVSHPLSSLFEIQYLCSVKSLV